MNHYVRSIGSLLILVYSVFIAFFFIDKVFANIIYFQGMFYQQIFGLPVFLFLNILVILLCIVFGSILAYKINQQNDWIKRQIERAIEGETVGINDRQIELYHETIDLYKVLVPLNQELHKMRLKTQDLTNESYNLNDVKVKKIIEDERQRLARELHDSVSQQLFAASLMLSAIKETKLEPPLDQQIVTLEKMVQDSQLEMRALLLHLRPIGLNNKSLGEGIKDLVTDLQKKVPMKVVKDIEEFDVPKGIEDHLFRITQEAISNTLRHAKGTKVTIELLNREDYILLRIHDDGIGFNVDDKLEQSYGLKNMRERALEIGATFHIVSLPDSGTRIEVKAPFTKEENYAN
ncbi:sensor histidine kinase [Staphylococcus massiliensis]|uniref:Sensor protein VraS n=2 Tax=Staphylococcus massiliensis TaxID=555791 RepID=K9ALE2_9STAP|nr:sensor histidine kinase [Staphylococcus massiliensis]EKU46836.1 histidine kinase sensor [Staphylococcus massiliensis S46]MCG3399949.1 sensor histidine kinase [Staphylococcus massiliensis]MCG3402668.1 sensor histidine kinase [Staphylococcus massiliensis]MCG3412915.1 sensor histidine kinase [Staphylococcus massiliensis]